METTDITPREAIKLVEFGKGMTPKEREKILALAIFYLITHEPHNFNQAPPTIIADILWGFSVMINPQIPPFNPQFFMAISKNPGAFEHYK